MSFRFYFSTILILNFRTDRSGQIVYTKIRMLLKEFDHDLFAISSAPFGCRPNCSNFSIIIYSHFWVSDFFLMFYSMSFSQFLEFYVTSLYKHLFVEI